MWWKKWHKIVGWPCAPKTSSATPDIPYAISDTPQHEWYIRGADLWWTCRRCRLKAEGHMIGRMGPCKEGR